MTWLLDKSFHFISPHSLATCERRLRDRSKRLPGFFASKSAILVITAAENGPVTFELDRDMGRGLYAKGIGTLQQDHDGRVTVSGIGRVPLIVFFLQVDFCCMGLVLAYVFRPVPFVAVCFGFSALMALSFMRITFNNRNDLVREVIETLS